MVDMTSKAVSVHKDLQLSQIQSSEDDVKIIVDAILGFTDPFQDDVNELYCLSSGAPAKPDVSEDLKGQKLARLHQKI